MRIQAPTAESSAPSITLLIQDFVAAISRMESPELKAESGLGRYIKHIDQMLAYYDDSSLFDYPKNLQLFIQAVLEVGLERSLVGIVSYDEATGRYRDMNETLTALIRQIWLLTRNA